MPSESKYRRIPGRLLAALVAAGILGAAPAVTAAAVRPASPDTATCTTSWADPDSGAWGTAANWSNGFPVANSVACITVPGSYTVSFVNGDTAPAVLILGSGVTGDQETLQVTNACSQAVPSTVFELTGPGTSTIASTGVITINSNSTPGATCNAYTHLLVAPGATLHNEGAIKVIPGLGGSFDDNEFDLGGAFHNSGSVTLDTPTVDDFSTDSGIDNGTWNNQGALDIVDTAGMTGSLTADNLTFTSGTGGSVGTTTGSAASYFYDRDENGTAEWIQGGGNTGGNPVVIQDGTVKYTGTGTSDIDADGTTVVSGTIPATATLTLGDPGGATGCGCGTVTTLGAATVTNNGHVAESATGSQDDLEITSGQTFDNVGVLTAQPGGGDEIDITGTFDNTGTVTLNAPTSENVSNPGGTWDNQGALNIADGASMAGTSLAFTDAIGGSVETTGDSTSGYFVDRSGNGAAAWIQSGGTTTGDPVFIQNGTVKYTGTGASKVDAEGSTVLTGTIPAADTLTLGNPGGPAGCNCSDIDTLGAATMTNHGTLVETSISGQNRLIVASGQTLDNTGTVTSGVPGSDNEIDVAGTFDNTGTVTLKTPTAGSGGGTWENNKTIVVYPKAYLGLADSSLTSGSGATLKFRLASATSFGFISGVTSIGLAGTAGPVLVSGYHPPAGTAFEVIQSPNNGTFSTVDGGFTARYTPASGADLVAG
jgi:hypothetical protein